MALINCIECGREISEKATHCVHCGCPIAAPAERQDIPTYSKPALPNNIDSLGFKKQGMASYLEFPCHVVISNSDGELSDPKGSKLSLYQRGFEVGGFGLNYNQVVDWKVVDSDSIMEADKSPLLRAALGGVLLGGVGAIVGGVSGLSKKQRSYDKLLSLVVYKPKQDAFLKYHIAYSSKKADRVVLAFHNEIARARELMKTPTRTEPDKAIEVTRFIVKKVRAFLGK